MRWPLKITGITCGARGIPHIQTVVGGHGGVEWGGNCLSPNLFPPTLRLPTKLSPLCDDSDFLSGFVAWWRRRDSNPHPSSVKHECSIIKLRPPLPGSKYDTKKPNPSKGKSFNVTLEGYCVATRSCLCFHYSKGREKVNSQRRLFLGVRVGYDGSGFQGKMSCVMCEICQHLYLSTFIIV